MYGIYESGEVIAEFATPLTVRSNHPVFASDTLSLSRQVIRRTAQRWEIEARIVPLSSTANILFSNLITKGYSVAFDVVMPQNYGAILNRTASGSVTASGSINASVVTLSGLSGLLPSGTFIKFASHNKIYVTLEDRSGSGSVIIYPGLFAGLSGIAMTYKDDVLMKCLYDLDTTIGMVYSDGILMDMGTIRLIEKPS